MKACAQRSEDHNGDQNVDIKSQGHIFHLGTKILLGVGLETMNIIFLQKKNVPIFPCPAVLKETQFKCYELINVVEEVSGQPKNMWWGYYRLVLSKFVLRIRDENICINLSIRPSILHIYIHTYRKI